MQALQAFAWTEREINARLRNIMDKAFADVHATADRYGVSLRTAALIAAVGRVAEAVTVRGIYP